MFDQTKTAGRWKGQKILFLSLVTLTFDLQTRPSEGPNMCPVWIWCRSVQQFPRYRLKTPFFCVVILTFDLWQSNSCKRGTKHVFPVNLAQIHSAVPQIFHSQIKNHRLMAPKTEPSAVHCVWWIWNETWMFHAIIDNSASCLLL